MKYLKLAKFTLANPFKPSETFTRVFVLKGSTLWEGMKFNRDNHYFWHKFDETFTDVGKVWYVIGCSACNAEVQDMREVMKK